MKRIGLLPLMLVVGCARPTPVDAGPSRAHVEEQERQARIERDRLRVQAEIDERNRPIVEERERRRAAEAEEERSRHERMQADRQRNEERLRVEREEYERTLDEVRAADERDRARGHVTAGHCCDGTAYAASCKGRNCCAQHGGYCAEKPRPGQP